MIMFAVEFYWLTFSKQKRIMKRNVSLLALHFLVIFFAVSIIGCVVNLHKKGIELREQGKYAEAIIKFRKSINMFPADDDYYDYYESIRKIICYINK